MIILRQKEEKPYIKSYQHRPRKKKYQGVSGSLDAFCGGSVGSGDAGGCCAGGM